MLKLTTAILAFVCAAMNVYLAITHEAPWYCLCALIWLIAGIVHFCRYWKEKSRRILSRAVSVRRREGARPSRMDLKAYASG